MLAAKVKCSIWVGQHADDIICYDLQGGFFDWSALKMTECQPLKEFSELVLPKKTKNEKS